MRDAIARWLLDTLGLVPVDLAADYTRFGAEMQAMGLAHAEQYAMLGAAVTAAKAGLAGPDEMSTAIEIGARMLAHGFTGRDIDEMIQHHYQLKCGYQILWVGT